MKANILYHTYYGDLTDLFNSFQNNSDVNFYHYFNICTENTSSQEIIKDIRKNISNAFVTCSSNVGKDIGGKLILIDLALNMNSDVDFYVFLHDKRSPHSSLGETWKKKIARIIQPEKINNVLELFTKDKNIGIIASKEFISNEYDTKNSVFNSTNNKLIKELITNYSLHLTNYDFVGGTMFWVRADIINSFFKKNNPLTIRATLEKGNVMDNEQGTYTHSWERMFSWIALDQGYYIKGIW